MHVITIVCAARLCKQAGGPPLDDTTAAQHTSLKHQQHKTTGQNPACARARPEVKHRSQKTLERTHVEPGAKFQNSCQSA